MNQENESTEVNSENIASTSGGMYKIVVTHFPPDFI